MSWGWEIGILQWNIANFSIRFREEGVKWFIRLWVIPNSLPIEIVIVAWLSLSIVQGSILDSSIVLSRLHYIRSEPCWENIMLPIYSIARSWDHSLSWDEFTVDLVNLVIDFPIDRVEVSERRRDRREFLHVVDKLIISDWLIKNLQWIIVCLCFLCLFKFLFLLKVLKGLVHSISYICFRNRWGNSGSHLSRGHIHLIWIIWIQCSRVFWVYNVVFQILRNLSNLIVLLL